MTIPHLRCEADVATSRLGVKPSAADDDEMNARVLSLLTINKHLAHHVVQRLEPGPAASEEDEIDAEVRFITL